MPILCVCVEEPPPPPPYGKAPPHTHFVWGQVPPLTNNPIPLMENASQCPLFLHVRFTRAGGREGDGGCGDGDPGTAPCGAMEWGFLLVASSRGGGEGGGKERLGRPHVHQHGRSGEDQDWGQGWG